MNVKGRFRAYSAGSKPDRLKRRIDAFLQT
jgi:hypothetical protein